MILHILVVAIYTVASLCGGWCLAGTIAGAVDKHGQLAVKYLLVLILCVVVMIFATVFILNNNSLFVLTI